MGTQGGRHAAVFGQRRVRVAPTRRAALIESAVVELVGGLLDASCGRLAVIQAVQAGQSVARR